MEPPIPGAVVFPPDGEDWLPQAPSPAFVVHLGVLEQNARTLREVADEAGCKILAALKAYSLHSTFPILARHLHGACASGVHEARLAHDYFGGEVHCFAPAYTSEDMAELLPIAHHLVFNSAWQWERYRPEIRGQANPPRCGFRVNPEHSEGTVPLYDPCAPGSRLGMTREALEKVEDWDGISGLHFHTLCEHDSDALVRTLEAFEARFAPWFDRLDWVNFGGGHHITRPGYDRRRLMEAIRGFRARHHLEVYLEPGEAVALNAGVLIATVLDLIENGGPMAILDVSATAHMPDVLEMPYRPMIQGAGEPAAKPYRYRLGGMTCLAGDVIGEYSFDRPLARGDRLVFGDMAHYTMVKTTFFNGVRHPAIANYDPQTKALTTQRRFGYEDFRDRLG